MKQYIFDLCIISFIKSPRAFGVVNIEAKIGAKLVKSMCGIAGSINFPIQIDDVKAKMGHRGPDAATTTTCDNVSLCHLRLAILDIEGGVQPMHLFDRYTIIFNGEIYNHLDVRKELQLDCKSHSDTETILAAYHKKGPACLHYFDGMFAFCIYDKKERILFLARDRAGKKPIYIYRDSQKLLFASELNLIGHLVPLELEESHFDNYFRIGAFYRKQTPFKNVTELLNGNYAIINTDDVKYTEVQWWSIFDQYNKKIEISETEAIKKVESMIETAVIRRMDSSDLEVGCFLSGGIDSGIITALAAKHRPSLKTFTVSFNGQFDESKLARLVADKYGTQHETISISFGNLKNDLEKILFNYGEPFFDSSSIPSYYVSKAAKEHITVVLNGDGADELFGGYRRFVPFAHFNLFDTGNTFRKLMGVLSGILPPGNNKKSLYNYAYRLLFLSSQHNPELFIAAGPDIFEGSLHHFHGLSAATKTGFDKDISTMLSKVNGGLSQIMSLDFDINLFSDLLVKMDIASMANSLEGRSPMLCKELLEFVPGLPDNLKIRGGTTKYLLRKIASGLLPGELINQPKRGFEIPLKTWVNEDLNEIIMDYLNGSSPFYSKFISQKKVQELIAGKWQISEEKRAKMLWSLFCVEVWNKKCFLKN